LVIEPGGVWVMVETPVGVCPQPAINSKTNTNTKKMSLNFMIAFIIS
jgi:hypothetical protein